MYWPSVALSVSWQNLDSAPVPIRESIAYGRLTHVEFLVAGSSLRELESVFGHSAIRLIFEKDGHSQDLTLSFVAFMEGRDGEVEKVAKGILGGYKTVPELRTTLTYLHEQMFIFGRSLQRLPLHTDERLRQRVQDLALSVLKGEAELGTYKFLNRNCLTYALEFLEKAGFATNLSAIQYSKTPPIHSLNVAFKSALLQSLPPHQVLTAKENLKRLERTLKMEVVREKKMPKDCDRLREEQQKKLEARELGARVQVGALPVDCNIRLEPWTEQEKKRISSLQDAQDIWFLFYLIHPQAGSSHREYLKQEIQRRGRPYMALLDRLQPYPKSAVEKCSTAKCAKLVVQSWIDSGLIMNVEEPLEALYLEYFRSSQLTIAGKIQRSGQSRHMELLIKELCQRSPNRNCDLMPIQIKSSFKGDIR